MLTSVLWTLISKTVVTVRMVRFLVLLVLIWVCWYGRDLQINTRWLCSRCFDFCFLPCECEVETSSRLSGPCPSYSSLLSVRLVFHPRFSIVPIPNHRFPSPLFLSLPLFPPCKIRPNTNDQPPSPSISPVRPSIIQTLKFHARPLTRNRASGDAE